MILCVDHINSNVHVRLLEQHLHLELVPKGRGWDQDSALVFPLSEPHSTRTKAPLVPAQTQFNKDLMGSSKKPLNPCSKIKGTGLVAIVGPLQSARYRCRQGLDGPKNMVYKLYE